MLFRFVRKLVTGFIYCIFFVKVHNREKFPLEGPVIVSFNHKSYWDIPLTDTVLPRPLCFMAKRDLFDIPLLGGIMKWSGAFPVSRGKGDVGAIKTAVSVLKQDKAMAIFPEGRRVMPGQEHRAKPGVALIAELSGAPILPVAIKGDYKLFRRMEIFIGDPVYVKRENGEKLPVEELQKISEQVLDTILTMAEVK